MLLNDRVNLNDVTGAVIDWPWDDRRPDNFLWSHETSGSGGYSEHIFRYAAETLFDQHMDKLTYKQLRYEKNMVLTILKDRKMVVFQKS